MVLKAAPTHREGVVLGLMIKKKPQEAELTSVIGKEFDNAKKKDTIPTVIDEIDPFILELMDKAKKQLSLK